MEPGIVSGSAPHRDDGEPLGRGAAPWALAGTGECLLVLSRDEQLLETLHRVFAGRELLIVRAESELGAPLMDGRVGVVLLDAQAVSVPVAELTQRLRAQFPDLGLVVAGGTPEQAALAAQVADGTVHRFLHKPVSEQRVKLFVDAAWRRHEQEQASASGMYRQLPLPGAARLPRPVLVGAAGAVAGAVAIVAWLALRSTEPVAAPPAPQPPAVLPREARGDRELAELLARAEAALAQGAWVEPAGESAADLYRGALAREPGNARAAEGLERVIDGLLSAAEKALLEERLEEAAALTESARGISPDHVRVAFVSAQIGKERERALLAQARQAASSGDVGRAIAVLDGAAREGQQSTLIAETRQELAQQQIAARVRELLRRAEARIASGALLEPAQDNARFFIESARTLVPEDEEIARVQRALAEELLVRARETLAAGDGAGAEPLMLAAEEAGVSRARILEAQREVQRAQLAAQAEALARLAQLFNQRLAEGRLLEPAADSAKAYLAQLTAADAAHPSTAAAREQLAARLLAEARAASGRGDFPGAQRWLAEAAGTGASPAAVAAAERELAAARSAAEEVAASALRRVRYVEPRFPEAARERGTSGYVDLVFTVRADGSVGDVSVTGAEPAGVFEEAAIDAVRRWRYRPVERAGRPVEQRARLRVRFAVE